MCRVQETDKTTIAAIRVCAFHSWFDAAGHGMGISAVAGKLGNGRS